MIKARTYPDDHALDITFDATPYLQNASTEGLQKLIACGFGGDYAADQVAITLADTNEQIAAMFTYLEARNKTSRKNIGFEVHINEDQAITWLAQHRPDTLEALDLADYDLARCERCGRVTSRDDLSKDHKKSELLCGPCSRREEDDEERRSCDICGFNISEYAPGEIRCGACVNTYGDPVSGADPIDEEQPRALTNREAEAVVAGNDVACPECGWRHLTTDLVDGAHLITCPECPYSQQHGPETISAPLTLQVLHDLTARLLTEGANPDLPLAFDMSSASTTEGPALITSAILTTVNPRENLPQRELMHYDEADLEPYEAVLLQ